MRHLIVGAGNMGKRHGSILSSFGDDVAYVDLGWDQKIPAGTDSILICTPPETHSGLINALSCGVPLFVEKPVCVDGSILLPPSVSMVACNWRWCPEFPIWSLVVGYDYADLDMIHFLDAFWDRHGEPGCLLKRHGDELTLTCFHGTTNMEFTLRKKPGTLFDGNVVDHSVCGMFRSQMEFWREVASGKRESPNPIQTARERTLFLLELLHAL